MLHGRKLMYSIIEIAWLKIILLSSCMLFYATSIHYACANMHVPVHVYLKVFWRLNCSTQLSHHFRLHDMTCMITNITQYWHLLRYSNSLVSHLSYSSHHAGWAVLPKHNVGEGTVASIAGIPSGLCKTDIQYTCMHDCINIVITYTCRLIVDFCVFSVSVLV